MRESFRAWVNYHPYTIVRLLVAAVRTAAKLEKHPRFVSIRFEDLLQHTEVTVGRLCDFAGIDFEVGMLDVPQVGSSSRQDCPDKRGIEAGRSGAWRKGGLSSVELAIRQSVTIEEMIRLGYSVEPVGFLYGANA